MNGPSQYLIQYTTTIGGNSGAVIDSCSLASTTQAACYGSVALDIPGLNVDTFTSATYTSLQYIPVRLTAGVSKLPASVIAAAATNAVTTGVATTTAVPGGASTSAATARASAVSNSVSQ